MLNINENRPAAKFHCSQHCTRTHKHTRALALPHAHNMTHQSSGSPVPAGVADLQEAQCVWYDVDSDVTVNVCWSVSPVCLV